VSPFGWTRMVQSIPAETEEEKVRIARASQMTPEKVAPLVVYLASDAADGITGQILSARNNEIYLFNQNRPIRTLHRADGWTPQTLAAQLKGRLRLVIHAARTLARRLLLGPDLINDHRLQSTSTTLEGSPFAARGQHAFVVSTFWMDGTRSLTVVPETLSRRPLMPRVSHEPRNPARPKE
jgi:hypothetical protein